MSRQPKKMRELLAGIGSAVFVAPWVFHGILFVLDWIGRAQTAMTLAPYLGVLASPVAFIVEFLVAVGLLFYATRLEHQREVQETPIIIRPWSEPEKPKRHWFWIKMSIGSVCLSLVGASIAFQLLRSYKSVRITPTLHTSVPSASTPSSGKATKSPIRGVSMIGKPKQTSEIIEQAKSTSGPRGIPLPVNPAASNFGTSGSPLSGDPTKTVEAVRGMDKAISQALGTRDTITFLMTWPDNDNSYLVFISTLLSDACRTTPRQCWFTQLGDGRDLDKPYFQGSGKRGITLHGRDVSGLANALGVWFTTYTTASVPAEIDGYRDRSTKEIIWVDIGPGSPWK